MPELVEIPGTVRAKIDPDWAAEVGKGSKIFQYNTYSAEDIGAHVSLPELGGLVIVCSQGLWTPEDSARNRRYYSQIDLAFDEDARVTDTEKLFAAAHEQRGADAKVTQQLQRRSLGTDEHGRNETWIIPESALELSVVLESVGE